MDDHNQAVAALGYAQRVVGAAGVRVVQLAVILVGPFILANDGLTWQALALLIVLLLAGSLFGWELAGARRAVRRNREHLRASGGTVE